MWLQVAVACLNSAVIDVRVSCFAQDPLWRPLSSVASHFGESLRCRGDGEFEISERVCFPGGLCDHYYRRSASHLYLYHYQHGAAESPTVPARGIAGSGCNDALYCPAELPLALLLAPKRGGNSLQLWAARVEGIDLSVLSDELYLGVG